MKRRIIRVDALNWGIQEWQEGGDIVARGRYAGQAKQAKWKAPDSFFRRLTDVAKRFLHDAIGDTVEDGEPVTGAQLIAAIEAAEASVVESVKASADALETSMLIGILQERGYTVTDGKKGRTTYADEECGK